MNHFEKIIKMEDFTPQQILDEYMNILPKGNPLRYAAWAENEIEEITGYLYRELKTGEQRIIHIERYIIEEEGKRHFLRHTLVQYIGEYFNDIEGTAFIESLGNAESKAILQLYSETIIPLHLSREKQIGIKEFPGHDPIPVYETIHPTPTMILAEGLLKLYQQAENETTIESPAVADNQERIEWTPERIADLEYCKNELKMFSYTSIEAVKEGEKIDAKDVHDIIGLLTAWGLQEEGTENKRNKIIEDNFTHKRKKLVSTTIGSYRRKRESYHHQFRELRLQRP